MQGKNDSWQSGHYYEKFIGRWSVPIAHEFLSWLAVPSANSWINVCCGIGPLDKLILETQQPKESISRMLALCLVTISV